MAQKPSKKLYAYNEIIFMKVLVTLLLIEGCLLKKNTYVRETLVYEKVNSITEGAGKDVYFICE